MGGLLFGNALLRCRRCAGDRAGAGAATSSFMFQRILGAISEAVNNPWVPLVSRGHSPVYETYSFCAHKKHFGCFRHLSFLESRLPIRRPRRVPKWTPKLQDCIVNPFKMMNSASKWVMTSTRSNQGPGRIPNRSVGPKPDPKMQKMPYKHCREWSFLVERGSLRPPGPAATYFFVQTYFFCAHNNNA